MPSAESLRRCCRMNRPIAKGAATSIIHIHHAQPAARPSVRGKTTRNTASAPSATPARSSPTGCSERLLGTNSTVAATSRMPTGTLMRKIPRHPVPSTSAVTSHPPRSSPAIAPIALSAPTTPNIGPRSSGANMTCTLESTCGTMMPANAPCTTRVVTSMSPLHAREASPDATVKPMTPMSKMLRLPNMSPRRPPVMRSVAKAIT